MCIVFLKNKNKNTKHSKTLLKEIKETSRKTFLVDGLEYYYDV